MATILVSRFEAASSDFHAAMGSSAGNAQRMVAAANRLHQEVDGLADAFAGRVRSDLGMEAVVPKHRQIVSIA